MKSELKDFLERQIKPLESKIVRLIIHKQRFEAIGRKMAKSNSDRLKQMQNDLVTIKSELNIHREKVN